MKVASKVQKGETLSPSLSFFSQTPKQCAVTNANQFLDPQVQAKIYEDRTARLVESPSCLHECEMLVKID